MTKATIEIDTHSDLKGDIKTQDFSNSTITYYDANGKLITYEYIDTIQQAIEQNKNGMTLVANNGKGTVINYDAQIKDKIEHKTYSVPFLAEFSVKNVVTENDLKKAIKKNKPEIKYDWEGTPSNVIDEIIVRHIDEYTVNEYTYDMASGKYIEFSFTANKIYFRNQNYARRFVLTDRQHPFFAYAKKPIRP